MGMQLETQSEMARRRALLTDRERELLGEDHDAPKNYEYQAVSRVRNKIQEELVEDIEILMRRHPDLVEELKEVVCEGDP